MALIKCHECGKEVSTSAKTCPHCGSKVKQPTSTTTKLVAVLLGVGMISAIVGSDPSSKPPERKAEETAGTKRYTLAKVVEKTLQKAVRDPDSLKFDSMRINDSADIACAEYRARNGFGGMNREIVVIVKGAVKTDNASWNKHCVGGMYDYLYAVD